MDETAGLLRVLLVEDDASIRRFVALALEDEPLQLTETDGLAEARRQLAARPFDVVIADLMLGDGNGLDLLQELGARPGTTRIAFSAGIDRTTRARLEAIGVTELLTKPVSVDALLDAVARAGRRRSRPATDPASPPPSRLTAGSMPEATPSGGGAPLAGADVVGRFFGGDHGLFALYQQQCLAQFADDLREGEALVEASDVATLRRLAHSLKSVLSMLGEEEGSACARALEHTAATGDVAGAARGWRPLAATLQALRTRGGGGTGATTATGSSTAADT